MNREELIENLSSDILTYVMHGSFPESRFASEIKPVGLDDRFNDYEMLVRLHFILRPEVVDFVEELPERIREIQTETRNVSNTVRGRTEGRINWSRTMLERYSTNPNDNALFVCNNRTEDYDTDENIVLKKLLSTIYNTLTECDQYLRKEYDWVTERWQENLDLIDTMIDLFERNVHVNRIRDPAEYEPSDRSLQRVTDSRSGLYRQAATLLNDYRETLDGDESALRRLLETSAITPDDDETLLELFVLFRYISTIERLDDGEFVLQTIETDRQEVARMRREGSDTEVVLYHDNSGRDRGLSFDSTPPEDKSELNRHEMVKRQANQIAQNYFQNERLGSRTGRPDVIVLEIKQGDTHEYLITEVKNSARIETIHNGIEETLEYLAFLQQNSEYVFDSGTDYLGDGYNGVLVVQDVPDSETADLDEQDGQPIRILQASEVDTYLREIIERSTAIEERP